MLLFRYGGSRITVSCGPNFSKPISRQSRLESLGLTSCSIAWHFRKVFSYPADETALLRFPSPPHPALKYPPPENVRYGSRRIATGSPDVEASRCRSYSARHRVGTLSVCPTRWMARKNGIVVMSFNHQSRYSRPCDAAVQKMFPLPQNGSTNVRPRFGRNETIFWASRALPPGYAIVGISRRYRTAGQSDKVTGVPGGQKCKQRRIWHERRRLSEPRARVS